MSPWIETVHAVEAARWLDQSAVALRGQPVRTRSDVAGALHRTQQPPVEQLFGRSSVQATLTLRQFVTGASSGVSSVSGLIGWLQLAEASSSGSSQVSGELLMGVARYATAVSNGSSSVPAADLSVKRYSFIAGTQTGDDWSYDNPTVAAGRDDGHTRRRFTPHSIGLTNERETWRK